MSSWMQTKRGSSNTRNRILRCSLVSLGIDWMRRTLTRCKSYLILKWNSNETMEERKMWFQRWNLRTASNWTDLLFWKVRYRSWACSTFPIRGPSSNKTLFDSQFVVGQHTAAVLDQLLLRQWARLQIWATGDQLHIQETASVVARQM